MSSGSIWSISAANGLIRGSGRPRRGQANPGGLLATHRVEHLIDPLDGQRILRALSEPCSLAVALRVRRRRVEPAAARQLGDVAELSDRHRKVPAPADTPRPAATAVLPEEPPRPVL